MWSQPTELSISQISHIALLRLTVMLEEMELHSVDAHSYLPSIIEDT
jgi:hypothetical protein